MKILRIAMGAIALTAGAVVGGSTTATPPRRRSRFRSSTSPAPSNSCRATPTSCSVRSRARPAPSSCRQVRTMAYWEVSPRSGTASPRTNLANNTAVLVTG